MNLRFTVDPATGCHNWTGSKSEKGYAIVRLLGKTVKVTRLLWSVLVGPIPAGALICHTCDNKGCINLAHLYCGTHATNVADAVERKRYSSFKGQANASAVLTEDDVRAIRASSEPGIVLAARHKVTPATISKIKSRALWKHVV